MNIRAIELNVAQLLDIPRVRNPKLALAFTTKASFGFQNAYSRVIYNHPPYPLKNQDE